MLTKFIMLGPEDNDEIRETELQFPMLYIRPVTGGSELVRGGMGGGPRVRIDALLR